MKIPFRLFIFNIVGIIISTSVVWIISNHISYTSYIEVEVKSDSSFVDINKDDNNVVYVNKSISDNKKKYLGTCLLDTLTFQNIIFNAPIHLSESKESEYYITEVIKLNDFPFYILYIDKIADKYNGKILLPIKKKFILNYRHSTNS